MAFTGTSIDLARLRDAFCAVTAPAPVQPIGHALVADDVVFAPSVVEMYPDGETQTRVAAGPVSALF